MIRNIIGSCAKLRCVLPMKGPIALAVCPPTRLFSLLHTNPSSCTSSFIKGNTFSSTQNFRTLNREPIINQSLLETLSPFCEQKRTLIKYSLHRGKRKTVGAVLKRFYRLDWGIWIRTKCGRHKKMSKKSPSQKRRLRRHVFTNATQSWLLDTMVTRYWRKPKYIPDSPYNPYHKREEFYLTRRKPHVPVAS